MNVSTDPGSHWIYNIPFLDDTRSNYDNWKFRMSTVLRLRGLMEIVLGVEKCLPEITTDSKDQDTVTVIYDKWQTQNY